MSRRSGGLLPLALCLCLCLSGCAAMLERSYSFSELYVNRYWDTGAGDTLRAGTYQDLVNSLLMLVEQRAEEGVVRYSARTRSYNEVYSAVAEVRQKTALGSYLLRSMLFRYDAGEDDCTITVQIAYREDAEDVGSLMLLSDSQSLVDLLRLHLREEHQRLTAQFVYETERREDVLAAVQGLWTEMCLEEQAKEEEPPPEGADPLLETEPDVEADPPEEPPEEEPPPEPEPEPPPAGEEEPQTEEIPPAEGEEPAAPAAGELELPPCPWEVRFYPDTEYAGIVEIWLHEAGSLDNAPAEDYNEGQADS